MNPVPAPVPPASTHRRTRLIAESVIVAALLLFRLLSSYKEVRFHHDEAHWIDTSEAFEALLSPLSSPHWEVSYTTLTQPPAVRYVVALGRIAGGYTPEDLPKVSWDYGASQAENLRRGAMPDDRLLFWSRLPMGLLAVGIGVAVFLGAYRLGGAVAAYTWVGLFLFSHFLRYHFRVAMGESPLVGVILLAILLCCWIARRSLRTGGASPGFGAFLLLGVIAGFAGAVKLNGLAIGGAGLAVLAALALRQGHEPAARVRLLAVGGVALALGAAGTFFAVNPFLWREPVARVKRMFEMRVTEMKAQTEAFPEARLDTLSKRAVRIPRQIFQDCAALGFRGFFPLNLALTLIGAFVLVRGAMRWLREPGSDPLAFCVLAGAAFACAPTLLSPLDWGRYFILPVVFSTFLIAVGVGTGATWIRDALGQRTARAT
jgi:hypothetical protein